MLAGRLPLAATLRIGVDALLPSWWEAAVAGAAALFIIALYAVLRSPRDELLASLDDTDKMCQIKGNSQGVVLKLELLAAKNLAGANSTGTPDPYVIITCGEQKRFSSMIPGTKNPVWGEEFNFFVDSLPTQLKVTIYDWDIIRKCNAIGYVALTARRREQTGAIWHSLVGSRGQVCLSIKTLKLCESSSRDLNAQRRTSVEGQNTVVDFHKRGPLQTIFHLPPDEVLARHYSCALEQSFLYHGRMYVSAWHICFHSNVFSKQIKVLIPFGDIYEIRRSQQSGINPAITIVLRTGAGGFGVPPLGSTDGKVRYKFASFWNRNNTFKSIQKVLFNYYEMMEAQKKEQASKSSNTNKQSRLVGPKDSDSSTGRSQQFIRDDVLVPIYNDTFPCTAEQFFIHLLSEASQFTAEYRDARKDTSLILHPWHVSGEFDGQVREITFRSLCTSPMCPPDTAMTELQHMILSADKTNLIFETIQQAHDVPFGACFEIHCRWSLKTTSPSSCSLKIKVGTHFKKWCMMQSKIKSGALDEYKKEVGEMLEVARNYLVKADVPGHVNDESSAIYAKNSQQSKTTNSI